MDTITCECGQVEYVGTNYCLKCGRAIISIEKKQELAKSVRPVKPREDDTCVICGSRLTNFNCPVCDEVILSHKNHLTLGETAQLPIRDSPRWIVDSGFSMSSGTSLMSGTMINIGDMVFASSGSSYIDAPIYDEPIGYVEHKPSRRERVLTEVSKLLKRLAKDYPDILLDNNNNVLVRVLRGSNLIVWMKGEDLIYGDEVGDTVWLRETGEEIGRVLDIKSTPQDTSIKQLDKLSESETTTGVSTVIDEIINDTFEKVVSSLNSGMSYLTRMVETTVSKIYKWSVSTVTDLRERVLRKLNSFKKSEVVEPKAVEDISHESLNDGIEIRRYHSLGSRAPIGFEVTRPPKPARQKPINTKTIRY